MHYEGTVFRPPSEAKSILLQVTVGCSHNKCTFCNMYKEERFKIKSDEIILADIAYAAKHCKRMERLFICDGDALILSQKRLLAILKEISRQLPWVTRVGIYANTKSLKSKTPEQLLELREHGLNIAYLGLETGDDVTLEAINKRADAQLMIDMGLKAKAAGIQLSVTVLLGIAGRERSQIHARESGRVLSAIDPEFVGALSLMLSPGTEIYEEYQAGRFVLLEPHEVLAELRTMIEHTELTNGRFHANHASNYIPIKAKLPEEKEYTLQKLDKAIAGDISLKPEYLRAF